MGGRTVVKGEQWKLWARTKEGEERDRGRNKCKSEKEADQPKAVETAKYNRLNHRIQKTSSLEWEAREEGTKGPRIRDILHVRPFSRSAWRNHI